MLKSLELKIPPGALAIACAAAMAGIAHQTPSLAWPFPGRLLVAGLLAAGGAGFGLAGVWSFLKARTTVNPHRPSSASALVVGGAYRITRNPMYLGLLLLLLAEAAFLANAPALAFPPAFVGYMNRFQIIPEERALLRQFGAAFSDYAKTVRRWI